MAEGQRGRGAEADEVQKLTKGKRGKSSDATGDWRLATRDSTSELLEDASGGEWPVSFSLATSHSLRTQLQLAQLFHSSKSQLCRLTVGSGSGPPRL